MKLKGVKIGFAVTGSHCTLPKVLPQIERLVAEGADVFPLVSPSVDSTNSRFGDATEWKTKLVKATGQKLINSITGAEPIGPEGYIDIFVVAPCTGNTLAKLVGGITDTAVLMGAKAHLRNQKPLLVAISTNDGLGINARNLGLLLNMKNVYVVPFGQDNPYQKPNSLVAKLDLLLPAVISALQGRQLQPVLINPPAEAFELKGQD